MQGGTRPTGTLPPLLPVAVGRSAKLAKCSALLEGDGYPMNGLCRRCCEGVMFLDWSIVCCCVIAVLRVAYCTLNVSVVGLLTQGVDTASINQSFKQQMVTSHSFETSLLNVPTS
jgi:hypothetical protein